MKSVSFHFFFCALTLLSLPVRVCSGQDDYARRRSDMVLYQIEDRGVKDPAVLSAMRAVPRHEFVPAELEALSYGDFPLPIGSGQTISQPYIVALMTELLKLKKTDRVLEIGTGSGYQAAVLARIAKEVYTIEIVDALAEKADETLKRLGYANVFVRSGDGHRGWPERAPFDAIIITAAPVKIPEPLVAQLKEGGRMVLPLGDRYQELILLTKEKTGVRKEAIIPVRFVPMTGEAESGR